MTSPRLVERKVQGAGLSLAVQERGDPSAPTVVAVHGYPDTQAVWEPVAARLADRFHTVTYDVRGAGRSDAPAFIDAYKLDLLMDDLAAVIDATSPGRPVHLVGHDWGSLQGWEAVTSGRLGDRIATYTSISGPSLDHVREWTRARLRRPTPRAVLDLARQALRSSYIGLFNTPGVAWAAELASDRGAGIDRVWRAALTATGAEVDESWPSPTLGADLANGMNLYRANIGAKLRHGSAPLVAVPVQLIVPVADPFVPPSLVAGLERVAPRAWRRDVPAGHWVPRTHPAAVARWVAELVDHVEGAEPAPRLARALVVAEGSTEGARKGSPTVVVTGAGSGIGRAIAVAFAEQQGATIVAADIDADGARRTAHLCRVVGGDGRAVVADVADWQSMESLAKTVADDFGVADVVVNNAGIAIAGSFFTHTLEDWEQILRVNLWGLIHGSLLLGRQMAEGCEGGHIVNVASAAAYLPSKQLPAYATTKAAALMLSECLRAELAGSGVGVTAVCPGFTNTPITTSTRYAGASPELEERLRLRAAKAYRRRNLSAEAVADAVVAAVGKSSPIVPVGAEARIGYALSRVAPGLVRRFARLGPPGETAAARSGPRRQD